MPRFETRESLSERLTAIFGDRTDDEALNFIQDSMETFDYHTANPGGISQEDHQKALDEQDQAWRKRYRDAFLNGKPDPKVDTRDKAREDPADDVPGASANNPAGFDDLFSAKGE